MYQFVETRSALSAAGAVQLLRNNRSIASRSIQGFPFNKKRLKVCSQATEIAERSNGIVYWMSRNQRVEDNWALLYAQALGFRTSSPLHVVFCLSETFLDATFRHYNFMLSGLQEVQSECASLNISFHLLRGQASEQLPKFVENHNMGAVVCDMSPLRVHRAWIDEVRKNLPVDVPFIQVDA